jgi:DNA-binding response OmpR family regulator
MMRYQEPLNILTHRHTMSNILLIRDDNNTRLSIQRVLSAKQIPCVCLDLKDLHPEFLLSGMFNLIIFELFRENRACVVILRQLERWTATSGIEHPPVIVVTEDGSEQIEQAVRTSKVNFFFVKPVDDEELVSAIQQSLLLKKTI